MNKVTTTQALFLPTKTNELLPNKRQESWQRHTWFQLERPFADSQPDIIPGQALYRPADHPRHVIVSEFQPTAGSTRLVTPYGERRRRRRCRRLPLVAAVKESRHCRQFRDVPVKSGRAARRRASGAAQSRSRGREGRRPVCSWRRRRWRTGRRRRRPRCRVDDGDRRRNDHFRFNYNE